MAKESRFVRWLKWYGRLTIFMIPIGVAINFVGGQIAILVKLPVYLDTMGTMLVGATCGAIPGSIVAVVSTILNSITSPTNLPYGILNIGIAVLAAFLSRRGMFLKLWKALLCIPLFSVIGGLGGAVVTLILYGGFSGAGSDFVTAAFVAAGAPINVAIFLSSIPLDLLDKAPQVIVLFIILSRIPTRLYTKLPLGYVYLQRRRGMASRPRQESPA